MILAKEPASGAGRVLYRPVWLRWCACCPARASMAVGTGTSSSFPPHTRVAQEKEVPSYEELQPPRGLLGPSPCPLCCPEGRPS